MDSGINGLKWRFGTEHEAFRDEVRHFIAGYAPRLDDRQFFLGRGGATRDLYKALGSRGWLSLTWPEALGGMGLPLSYEYILWNELAYARAARPDLGPGIIAKTIIASGTPDQQARYLPGIASGEHGFALGYSEPEAGSDLGAVRARALREGDVYRVSGEKRWTSDAHNSSYLWLLCRAVDAEGTDLGRTLLILDLAAPGVTIRPIPTVDGHRLNEVFLDGVEVPVTDRVGEEGQAWQLIREALAVERHLMLMPGRVRRDLASLVSWVEGHELAAADPVLMARIAMLCVDVEEVDVAALETLSLAEAGQDCTAAAARVKLLGSDACQAIARCALEAGYLDAAEREGDLGFLWRETIMETIAGGTSEIMRGVLARSVLNNKVRR